MNNYGLTLTGMIAASKVVEFTKKADNSKMFRFEASITDGENTYKYTDFILSAELAPKFSFGQVVEVSCNYARMDESRTIAVGGEIRLLDNPQTNKKAS